MILPCIDLMDGKVVQLVQGRDKALEGDAPLEMLRRFAAFPEIQVIDLDAAAVDEFAVELILIPSCRSNLVLLKIADKLVIPNLQTAPAALT